MSSALGLGRVADVQKPFQNSVDMSWGWWALWLVSGSDKPIAVQV